MIKPYDEAPTSYRGLYIHPDHEEGWFTLVPPRNQRMSATSWSLLKAKIDTHLDY